MSLHSESQGTEVQVAGRGSDFVLCLFSFV